MSLDPKTQQKGAFFQSRPSDPILASSSSQKYSKKPVLGLYTGNRTCRDSTRIKTAATGRPYPQEYFWNTHRYSNSTPDPPLIGNGVFSLPMCSQKTVQKSKNRLFAKNARNDPDFPRGASRGGLPTFWARNRDSEVGVAV